MPSVTDNPPILRPVASNMDRRPDGRRQEDLHASVYFDAVEDWPDRFDGLAAAVADKTWSEGRPDDLADELADDLAASVSLDHPPSGSSGARDRPATAPAGDDGSASIFSFSLPFTIPQASPLRTLRDLRDSRLARKLTRHPVADRRPRSVADEVDDDSDPVGPRRYLRWAPSLRAALPFGADDKVGPSPLRVPQLQYDQDDSSDDESLFSHVSQMDNVRLRAIKASLRPMITRAPAARADAFSAMAGDVVILGGYRGSILRDAHSRRRVWIPIKVGLNIRKVDLALGLDDAAEDNVTDTIYPDGMLTHLGPVDVSRKLIRRLRQNPNCTVHEWSYDWRVSLDKVADDLHDFLRRLRARRRGRPAIVMAHSMGGLVAHAAMQRDPTLFRGLIYAGVPSSCVNILGPLKLGESVMLSSRVLSAEVTFSMRSSFSFLPLEGQCFVEADTAAELELDFFDPKTWTDYALAQPTARPSARRRSSSAIHLPSLPYLERKPSDEAADAAQAVRDYDNAVEYLTRVLPRVRAFKESLKFDPTKTYPPLAVVYGRTVPTVRGARVRSREAIADTMYEDMIFGAGDGVVHVKHLMPPQGFSVCARIASDVGHVSLFSDLDSVCQALQGILDAEAGLIKSEPIVRGGHL
ncbi:uncharacterized protein V1510DRAFT_415480 [Dipodascopsis tothii]|uniref:uncharacterized protein n=1 Tax=Dipodascopsis tothii TaxID=44089 RepID=UPI0034CD69A8